MRMAKSFQTTQILAAEAWENYVQASLQASISPSCKFALPERLIAKVQHTQ